ncbi:MAG: peptidoglycan recognition family protein [Planctomycetota bacterium]
MSRHLVSCALAFLALTLGGCVRPEPLPISQPAPIERGEVGPAPKVAKLEEPAPQQDEQKREEIGFYELAQSFGLKVSIDLVTGRRVMRDGTNEVVVMPSTKFIEINQRRFPLEGMIRWHQGTLYLPHEASAFLAEWLQQRPVPGVAGDPELFDGSEPGLTDPLRRAKAAPRRASSLPASSAATALPQAWRIEANRTWRYIVIHHSATDVGNAASFHNSHKQKWVNGLGYHFVIGNGSGSADGQVEVGPRWLQQNKGIDGGHAGNKQYNKYGVGICLVGNFDDGRPSPRQLVALRRLCRALMATYGIEARNVFPHHDVRRGSTHCPGKQFPFEAFKRSLL